MKLCILALLFSLISCKAYEVRKQRRHQHPEECRNFLDFFAFTSQKVVDVEPHFLVGSHEEGDCIGNLTISDLSEKILLADPFDTLMEACKNIGVGRPVRYCTLPTEAILDLLQLQGLRVNETRLLDLSRVDLTGQTFQGKCFYCPIISQQQEIHLQNKTDKEDKEEMEKEEIINEAQKVEIVSDKEEQAQSEPKDDLGQESRGFLEESDHDLEEKGSEDVLFDGEQARVHESKAEEEKKEHMNSQPKEQAEDEKDTHGDVIEEEEVTDEETDEEEAKEPSKENVDKEEKVGNEATHDVSRDDPGEEEQAKTGEENEEDEVEEGESGDGPIEGHGDDQEHRKDDIVKLDKNGNMLEKEVENGDNDTEVKDNNTRASTEQDKEANGDWTQLLDGLLAGLRSKLVGLVTDLNAREVEQIWETQKNQSKEQQELVELEAWRRTKSLARKFLEIGNITNPF